MKITPVHYAHMRDTIKAKLAKFPEGTVAQHRERLQAHPQVKDVEKRLRWDLFHAAGLGIWVCDNVYPYANDEHIDTALRQIMKDLNLGEQQ